MLLKSKIVAGIFFVCSIGHSLCGQPINANQAPTKSIGDQIKIQSIILKEERPLYIYVPKSYSKDSLKKFPVIFVIDNGINEDFKDAASILDNADTSLLNRVPEAIVVGLPNTHQNRDFVTKKNDKYSHSGGATNFVKFIQYEVIPFLEASYRLTENRTIIGKSLAGLAVTEILLKKPHLFSNYILLSPKLSWDKSAILKTEPLVSLSKKRVYIGVGQESRLQELTAQKLYQKFKALNTSSIAASYHYFEALNRSNIMRLGTYAAFLEVFDVKE